jgi:DNA-binding response OmpR family regulator
VDGFTGGRVLLLDEDGPARDALAEQLRASGHQVETADSAVRVDEAVAAHRPDLVLVALPADDLSRGLAAGERIRRTSGTPFVFVGGWLSLEERVRSFEAGVRHRGRVLSKTHLLNEVWGYEHYDVNLVEVHVSALRRKLELHGQRVVHTVRGVGYVLRTGAGVSVARATA